MLNAPTRKPLPASSCTESLYAAPAEEELEPTRRRKRDRILGVFQSLVARPPRPPPVIRKPGRGRGS